MQTEIMAVALTIAIVIATSIPIGHYMASVFSGRRTWLDPIAPTWCAIAMDRRASCATVTSRGWSHANEWLRALSDAGFEPRVVPFNHSELEPGRYEVSGAVRPA
jgi:hypothetical protein